MRHSGAALTVLGEPLPGLQGVSVNGRKLRTDGQYADAANNLSLPTWNRFDMGALQRDVTLGATVENVANTQYWESALGGYLTRGDRGFAHR